MKVLDKLLNASIAYVIYIGSLIFLGFFFITIYEFVCKIPEKGLIDSIIYIIQNPITQASTIVLSFLVAVITLKKTIDIQAIDSLAKLRTMLNSPEKKDINSRLIKEVSQVPELSIEELDYIGTIELGAIMHRKGIISDTELYNQFGYRVENICNSSLYEKITEDDSYYNDFKYIKDIVEKYSTKIQTNQH